MPDWMSPLSPFQLKEGWFKAHLVVYELLGWFVLLQGGEEMDHIRYL